MLYTSEHMNKLCRNFAEDMTISQLYRVMKVGGIAADTLSVSKIIRVVTSGEYIETLMNIASESRISEIGHFGLEIFYDVHVDIFWDCNKEKPSDKIIHLITEVAKSGYEVPLQAICDDLQIAISVW